MANMASVSYRIEGPKEILEKIKDAIVMAMPDKKHWTEYRACEILGFSYETIDKASLGGEISEEPSLGENTLEFYAEERWGLQDFAELLEKHFPDIKVYWTVEECGMEIYCTNDKEGKYFPERYWVDACIDSIYNSEYFKTKKDAYEWLDKLTYGRVKSEEDAEEFNADYEDAGTDCENFIYIHEFEVVE